MRVLVIGGAGVVGRSLLPLLASHEVSVLDIASKTGLEIVRFFRGSALDDALVGRAVQECDAVIHLAAVVPRGAEVRDPARIQSAFEVNVRSVYTALRAARDAGTRSFVHASSMSVYAQYGVIPIDPLSRPDSLTPYGLTKRLAEEACEAFAAADSQMTVTSLRLAVPTTDALWPRWRSPGSPGSDPIIPRMLDGHAVHALHPNDLAAAVEWALVRRGPYTAIPVTGDVDDVSILRPRGWQPRTGNDRSA